MADTEESFLLPLEPPPGYDGDNKQATSFLGGIGAGIGDAIKLPLSFLQGIPGAIGAVPEAMKPQPPLTTRILQDYYGNEGRGAQEAIRTGVETGVGGAVGSIPGVGPLLAPTAMALGGAGVDAVGNLIRGDELPSAGDLGERLGVYNTLGAAGAGVGAGVRGAKNAISSYRNTGARAAAEAASTGSADAGLMGFPKGSSPGTAETILTNKIKKASLDLEGTDLWNGGDTFNPNTLKFEGESTFVTPNTIQANIKNNLPKIGEAIQSTANDLMDAQKSYNQAVAGGLEIRNVLPEELPLDQIQAVATRLDKSFATRESAEVIRDALREADVDFSKLGEEKDIFQKLLLPKYLSVGGREGVPLKDLLDYKADLYRAQRAMQKYDVNRQARGTTNPSAFADPGAILETLDAVAQAVDSKISEKATEIITKVQSKQDLVGQMKLNDAVINVENYTPTRFDDLNRVYGALKDMLSIGLNRIISQMETIKSAKPPAEGYQVIGKSLGFKTGALLEGAKNLFYPPERAAFNRGQKTISKLQDVQGMRGEGAISDYYPQAGPILQGGLDEVGARLAQSMVAQALIPRDGKIFDSSPEVLQLLPLDEESKQKIAEVKNSPPAVRDMALSEVIRDNRDAFEPSKVAGYNVIGGRIHDPHERLAYADSLVRAEMQKSLLERDYLSLSKKLTALNLDGTIIDMPTSKGVQKQTPDSEPSVPEDVETLPKEAKPSTVGSLADRSRATESRQSYSY